MVALSLAVAGAIGVPAAASAATTQHHSVDGMQTKAICERVQSLNQAHVVRKGGTLISGSGCGWLGAKKKWGYDFYYVMR
ncbi:hypothetical protein OVA26_17035 [Microbacterium sp. SL62]|uniref:hypothetical protein n=1 Tax=Microbacterium sp. SL62 TaxID=2995139 RepID=UPI0022728FF9|nr:hypothetical protein [Microbacterium sp. SL62]MCY1718645.1 hypothetical protein [Microbacterium sp. SL62]